MLAAVVADDFTGANDCAGGFAERGFRAFSARGGFFPGTCPDVYVRSVESRYLGPAEARGRSRSAWISLAGCGRRLDYQRLDSTLRGNPGDEILGMLEASGPRKLAFCAAYPMHGRHIQGGLVTVRGVPLHKSEYARDPLSPSKTAWPERLFPARLALRIGRGPVAALRAVIRRGRGRVLCFDALSDTDLRAIARACLAEGIRHFAGASGLSNALAAEFGPARRPAPLQLPARRIVLAGSVSQTTMDQLEKMKASGLAPWIGLGEASGRIPARGFALSSLKSRSAMRRSGSLGARKAFAERRLRSLVRRGLRLGGKPQSSLWLLTGGHCAEIFFEALKLKGSWVQGMLLPGVPLLKAVSEDGRSVFCATKPGGFGGPDVIKRFMEIEAFR